MPERFSAVEHGTLRSGQFGELYNAAAKSLEPQGKSVKPRSAWQVMELETPRNRPLSYSGCLAGRATGRNGAI
jgi:hypothetical protein